MNKYSIEHIKMAFAEGSFCGRTDGDPVSTLLELIEKIDEDITKKNEEDSHGKAV